MNSSWQPSGMDTVQRKKLTDSIATFMSQVYFWMMIGLIVTGVVAYEVTTLPNVMSYMIHNRFLVIGLVVAQFVAVGGLVGFLPRMTSTMAIAIYLLYAALVGLTLSVVCFAFTTASISQAFFLTAFSFAGLSIFGYVTKRDLGPIGSFCMTGLWGLVGFWLIGMIFPSILTNAVQMAADVLGIVIFAGLTAWDTQKIKNFHNVSMGSAELAKKSAIHGALMLYLDFINLFLLILQLTGRRK